METIIKKGGDVPESEATTDLMNPTNQSQAKEQKAEPPMQGQLNCLDVEKLFTSDIQTSMFLL